MTACGSSGGGGSRRKCNPDSVVMTREDSLLLDGLNKNVPHSM